MAKPAMRCLFLHNYYQQGGGEDVSLVMEMELLRHHGHTAELLSWHNDSLHTATALEKAAAFWRTTWNPQSIARVEQALESTQAELLHVQNFFPLASPSVYAAARRRGVPVVQHLRNFRLGCLNAYLYRNGAVCEACVGRNPWRGVVHRCYRQSLPASAAIWQMLTVHRALDSWQRVDAFIAPSRFAADKLVEIGMPAAKLHVKPNCITDPLADAQVPPPPAVPTFLYAGRLSAEKGVATLLQAWQQLRRPDWRLWIVGGGAMERSAPAGVTFWGTKTLAETLGLMQQASAVVVPSQWYETFGRVVIEAFACGRPALVSNLGALAELVADGHTGWRVPPADPRAWVERLGWCGEHRVQLAAMGQAARQVYLGRYTPEINYQQLMAIYQGLR